MMLFYLSIPTKILITDVTLLICINDMVYVGPRQ